MNTCPLKNLLKKLTLATLFAGTVLTAAAALKVGDDFPDLAKFKLEGKLPDARAAKKIRGQGAGHHRRE